MKRYVILGAALFFAVISAAVLLSLYKRPTETDFRLAKGRSQLFTENYLAALQTLRDIPDLQKRGTDTHSYLGAAYLKLHLYKAASLRSGRKRPVTGAVTGGPAVLGCPALG